MLVQISEIKINPGRREASPEDVQELAKSIAEVGLLNPITIDREHTLIAGLHRLEAAKLLGWTEIESTVSSLEGLQAELAEIDENFVRSDLSTLDHGELLLRRKEIYETLHPETCHGMRNGQTSKDCKMQSLETKSFLQETAEKLGVSKSTIARQIQTAKNLTPEAKAIIRAADAKVTKKDALKLSRLKPEKQTTAAQQLASGQIRSMAEYHGEPSAPEPVSEPQEPEPPADTKPPTDAPPFKLSDRQFTSFRESVADLKDPNKDCSCSPDSFLAEITAFVRKFFREIEWYGTPYYEAVFPDLTPVQRDYLRQQMDSICTAAQNLYHQVEGKIAL